MVNFIPEHCFEKQIVPVVKQEHRDTEQTVLTLQPFFKLSVRVTRCMCAKCVDAQVFMACILSYKSCLY